MRLLRPVPHAHHRVLGARGAPGIGLDLWLVEEPYRWVRLADLRVGVHAGDGLLELAAPFPLARRRLVIFKELSGTLDPARFNARAFFEAWPPPL